MKFLKMALIATAALALPSAANAAVVASLGGGTSPFLSLSQAGLAGGSVATLSGGTVYNSDRPFADIPAGSVFGNNFLAVGQSAGQPATLTFRAPVSYLSFLWGSPDSFNTVTLITSAATYTYNAQGLNFAVTNGNQNFSQYVQFATTAGETISSVSFNNTILTDAFETANFSVTAVPEPATWAMMLVGFGMVGATTRYRRRKSTAAFA